MAPFKLIGVNPIAPNEDIPLAIKTPKFYKFCSLARDPFQATDGSSGYDLSLCMAADNEKRSCTKDLIGVEDLISDLNSKGYCKCADAIFIAPNHAVHIHTGIAFEMPNGIGGLLMNRSSLSNHHRITLCDNVGLIDSDYRGEVTAHLYNGSGEIKMITDGDRACQIVFINHIMGPLAETTEISETTRGIGGYGSTGR